MLIDRLKTGARLGVVTGLVATLFEGLYMMASDMQVSSAYPIKLSIFNLSFWGACGMLSGFFLWLCLALGMLRQRAQERFYWSLFFLLPFALVYGIGGRIYPLFADQKTLPSHAFDHHLSLLWAMLLVGLLSLRYWRGAKERSSPPLAFACETFGLALLFHFGTNIKRIAFLFGIEGQPASLIVVYVLGVAAIGLLFLSVFPKFERGIEAIVGAARSDRLIAPVLALMVALTLVGALGPSRARASRHLAALSPPALDTQQARAKSGIPVILIVLDTVRADHLSIYGTHGKSKYLEAFAEDALVFDNARSVSSWTVPSHGSIFSGLNPREHGAHTDLARSTLRNPKVQSLPDELTTIAEVFKENGYSTAGIVANFGAAGRAFNFQQGFDLYDVRKGMGAAFRVFPYSSIFQTACYVTGFYPSFVQPVRLANAISEVAIDVVAQVSPGPFFLFLNYMDAHSGYRPPTPFDGYFLDTDYPKLHRMNILLQKGVTRSLSLADWTKFGMTQYDGAISYLDAELGKLFDHLRKMGLYDRSLIVVTSDHGELFNEHGFSSHHTILYEGAVKVPLLIKFPNSTRVGREADLISSADLFATILSIAGLPLPEGISGKAFGSEFLVSELYDLRYGTGEHRVLFRDRYKYMWFASKRPPELYDLRSDPSEQVNLASQKPEVVAAFEQDLRKWELAHQPRWGSERQPSGENEEKILENLKVLGYVE